MGSLVRFAESRPFLLLHRRTVVPASPGWNHPSWIRELGPEAWCCCDHPSCDAEERISRSRSRAAASWSRIIRCSPRLLPCSPPCTCSRGKIVDGFRSIVPVAVIDRPSDVLRPERPPFVGTDDRANRMVGRVREGVGGASRAQSRWNSRTLRGGPGHEPPERAPSSRSRMPRARSSIAASSIGLSGPRTMVIRTHLLTDRVGRRRRRVSWNRCFRAGHPESAIGQCAYGRQPRGAVFAAGRPDGYVRHVPDGRLLGNCEAASTIESRRHRATGVAFVPLRCDVIGPEGIDGL